MAKAKRDSKGRFVKKSRVKRATHKRRAVAKVHRRVYRRKRHTARRKSTRVIRAPRHAVILTNPRRRHRRARSNPKFGSFMPSKSTLKDIGFTVAGIAGTPFVEGFVLKAVPSTLLPTDPTFQKIVAYAVKIGSAVLVGWGVGKVAGREAGKMAYIGGASYVVVSAIKDFFPTLLGTTSGGTAMYPALAAQPLLGEYPSQGGMGSPITVDTPSRLQPEGRY